MGGWWKERKGGERREGERVGGERMGGGRRVERGSRKGRGEGREER